MEYPLAVDNMLLYVTKILTLSENHGIIEAYTLYTLRHFSIIHYFLSTFSIPPQKKDTTLIPIKNFRHHPTHLEKKPLHSRAFKDGILGFLSNDVAI